MKNGIRSKSLHQYERSNETLKSPIAVKAMPMRSLVSRADFYGLRCPIEPLKPTVYMFVCNGSKFVSLVRLPIRPLKPRCNNIRVHTLYAMAMSSYLEAPLSDLAFEAHLRYTCSDAMALSSYLRAPLPDLAFLERYRYVRMRWL